MLKDPIIPTGVVYGPIKTPDFGLALGINLVGDKKVCSYDCPYCDLGPSTLRLKQIKKEVQFPAVETISDQISQELQKIGPQLSEIESFIVSGNGEPTLYPNFPEVVDKIVDQRNKLRSDIKLVLFTNGMHLDTRKMIHAANQFDERVVKLDAGNDAQLVKVNNPLVRANVSKVISHCKGLNDVIIQSLFVKGIADNTDAESLEDWIEVVGMIKPKSVYIYGMSRKPSQDNLQACDEDELYTVASKLKRRTSIEHQVFFE